jgi:hypothetical protein
MNLVWLGTSLAGEIADETGSFRIRSRLLNFLSLSQSPNDTVEKTVHGDIAALQSVAASNFNPVNSPHDSSTSIQVRGKPAHPQTTGAVMPDADNYSGLPLSVLLLPRLRNAYLFRETAAHDSFLTSGRRFSDAESRSRHPSLPPQ